MYSESQYSKTIFYKKLHKNHSYEVLWLHILLKVVRYTFQKILDFLLNKLLYFFWRMFYVVKFPKKSCYKSYGNNHSYEVLWIHILLKIVRYKLYKKFLDFLRKYLGVFFLGAYEESYGKNNLEILWLLRIPIFYKETMLQRK